MQILPPGPVQEVGNTDGASLKAQVLILNRCARAASIRPRPGFCVVPYRCQRFVFRSTNQLTYAVKLELSNTSISTPEPPIQCTSLAVSDDPQKCTLSPSQNVFDLGSGSPTPQPLHCCWSSTCAACKQVLCSEGCSLVLCTLGYGRMHLRKGTVCRWSPALCILAMKSSGIWIPHIVSQGYA